MHTARTFFGNKAAQQRVAGAAAGAAPSVETATVEEITDAATGKKDN